MAVHHSTQLVASRESLREIAASRHREAERLFDVEHYAGAMFFGGCAFECYLKFAICKTLKLEGLPGVFKTHDFSALVLYSGFDRDLRQTPLVKKSFDEIVLQWKKDGRESLLYRAPDELNKAMARQFLDGLSNQDSGVVPWLLRMIS